MMTYDPEAELICSDEGCDDREIDTRTQGFKRAMFDRIAQDPEFLRETFVVTDKSNTGEDDADPEKTTSSAVRVVQGRCSIAERRRRVLVAEDALSALKSRDFDRSMHDVVIKYLSYLTGIEFKFFSPAHEEEEEEEEEKGKQISCQRLVLGVSSRGNTRRFFA